MRYSSNPPTVRSITGRVWMDRNIGASNVATASNNSSAYGSYYQHGRGTDGHEIYLSPVTSTLSNTDNANNGGRYITGSINWRAPANNNLWQGVNGVNNPCPSGFRLPTNSEWQSEVASWSSQNANGAFSSPLRLPLGGFRNNDGTGAYNELGTGGRYWSSTINNDSQAFQLFFNSTIAVSGAANKVHGMSVRCISN